MGAFDRVLSFHLWRRIAAFAALAIVILIVGGFAITQTAWFRDWLRQFITSQAANYLNGELQIGRLDGTLFTGIRLRQVRILQHGETVVGADSIALGYNAVTIATRGLILDDLSIDRPIVRLRRDASGWNVSNIVKKEAGEADRQGPGRPLMLRRIHVGDGHVDLDDRMATGADPVRMPREVTKFEFTGSFSYRPVEYTLTIDHLSLLARDPDAMLRSLTGTLAVRGDDVHVDKLTIQTAYSNLRADGMVQDYLGTPNANLNVDSNGVTLAEFAGMVPALRGLSLRPAFDVAVAGPLSKVQSDLQIRSAAGSIQGRVGGDLLAPDRTLRGDLSFSQLDISVLVPSQPASSITGKTSFDVSLDEQRRARGSAHVQLSPSRAAGYAIESAEAQAKLAGDRAAVTLRAAAYGATATADGTIGIPAEAATTLSFDVHGRLSHLALQRLPLTGVPRLRTDVTASYRAKREGDRLTARATCDRSSIEGAVLERGTTIDVQQSPGALSYAASGAITGLNPKRLGTAAHVAALADDRLDGPIDAHFTVDGRGQSLPTLSGTADLTVSRAVLPVAHLSEVRLTARVDRKTLDATVRGAFDAINPGQLTGRPDLHGTLAGTLDGQVALPDIQSPSLETASGRIQLALAPTTLAGQHVEQVNVSATLDRGQADVKDVTVEAGATKAHAAGTVALGSQGDSHLTYNVTAGSLAEFGKLAGAADLAGTATVDGTVTGNRDRFRTNGTISLTNAQYGTAFEALSTRGDYDVTVPALDVHKADASATIHTTLGKVGGQEIRDLTLKSRYQGESLEFDAAVAQAARRFEARGTAQLPQSGPIAVRLDHLLAATDKIAWSSVTGQPAEVTYTPTQLTVRNLDLVNGAQRFSISGDLNLEDAKAAANNEAAAAPPVATPSATPTALTLEVEHVDLGQLDDLLLGNRGFKGTLDAKAAVSGSLAAPLADASFTVSKGAAQTFTYDQLTATVHHDGSGAKVDLRLDQSPDAWVNVNAAVPALSVWRDQDARRTAPLSAHLTTSTIDLGLVQMFTTAVKEVTGTAHADLTASGTIGNPELSGSLSIDGGGFLVNETDTRFRGLQAAIRLHDDQIGIDTLHVLDEAGHPFNLTGTVAFAEKRVGSVDVRIDAQDFQVIKSKLGEMSLDVDGTVTGAMPALAIRTNVNVRQGRIEVDRVMEQLGGPTYATESQPIDTASLNAQPPPASPTAPVPAPTTPSASGSSEAAQPSLFDALTLDARLRIPNNLVLRGDDVKTSEGGLSVGNLNLTVGGDIHATKAANDRPVVVGSIRTVRGFYEFKGRRFDLQRDGTVSFKGPDPTDPTLDVTGIREISGIEARVRVHGTAKRPAIDISSTPPLDEADVLSLIVFNRPVNELGEGEQTSVAQTAATMVGNFAAAPLAEALRNALDVDLLEVSAGGDSGTGPSVAIGNQIGEKVFFKVKQEFGSADVTEFLLDYQLTDLLRLQTTAAQGAQTNRTPGHRVEPAALDFVFVKKY